MWTSRWSLVETAARHTTHTNGFLPECTRSCAARDSALWNLYVQRVEVTFTLGGFGQNFAMEALIIPSHLKKYQYRMD